MEISKERQIELLESKVKDNKSAIVTYKEQLWLISKNLFPKHRKANVESFIEERNQEISTAKSLLKELK